MRHSQECLFHFMQATFFLLLFLTSSATFSQPSSKAKAETLVCAHRGGFYSEFPENSLSLVSHTIAKSATHPVIIEFDVRKSKEGTLYVLHDQTVERTTNGVGKISLLSDSILNSLRLKNQSGSLSEESILPLQVWIDSLSKKECWFMFDVKDAPLLEVLSLIKSKEIIERSIVLTFTISSLSQVVEISNEIMVSYLIRNETDLQFLQQTKLPNNKAIAYINDETPLELTKRMQRQGIQIMTDASEFTRNNGKLYSETYYRNLVKSRGLDIVITDFPVEVSKILHY